MSSPAPAITTSHNTVLGKISVIGFAYDSASRRMLPVSPILPPPVTVDDVIITIKRDGECTYMKPASEATGGVVLPCRRREVKAGKKEPKDWFSPGNTEVAVDASTGNRIGFVPYNTDEKNETAPKHMLEAANIETQQIRLLNPYGKSTRMAPMAEVSGKTLEFMGPKSQGNADKLTEHCFYIHGDTELPRSEYPSFESHDALRTWFVEREKQRGEVFEGIVLRCTKTSVMWKITREYLGLKWK